MSDTNRPDPYISFLSDVKQWEGGEVAEATDRFLYGKEGAPLAPSPFMALFSARRNVFAADMIVAETMFATRCESQRD